MTEPQVPCELSNDLPPLCRMTFDLLRQHTDAQHRAVMTALEGLSADQADLKAKVLNGLSTELQAHKTEIALLKETVSDLKAIAKWGAGVVGGFIILAILGAVFVNAKGLP